MKTFGIKCHLDGCKKIPIASNVVNSRVDCPRQRQPVSEARNKMKPLSTIFLQKSCRFTDEEIECVKIHGLRRRKEI